MHRFVRQVQESNFKFINSAMEEWKKVSKFAPLDDTYLTDFIISLSAYECDMYTQALAQTLCACI